VVIPCYRQAHFLAEAVQSVCAQTYQDLEIVIVDDGSPDDTAEVAGRLIAAHPERRIRLIQQDNQGLPASRNRGIAASDAEYLVPLDADDKLAPRYVELKLAALDAHPEVAIADGDHHTFGADSQLILHSEYDIGRLARGNQIGVASMFRRRAWEDVGGYDEAMCTHNGVAYEDWDFWLGCAERGHTAIRVGSALFYYRVRPDSMFRQVNDQRSKAQIVLNHPVLYSPEQAAWARGVVDHDPDASAIDGAPYEVPLLGNPPAAMVRSGGAIDGARGLATLALAQELIEQPEILRAYCATFSGTDDATLVVLGGRDRLTELGTLLRELGQDGADDADVIGLEVAADGAELMRAAAMVDVLLTRTSHRLPVPLPRVDDADLGDLRARNGSGDVDAIWETARAPA
jgi:hypothetical protein